MLKKINKMIYPMKDRLKIGQILSKMNNTANKLSNRLHHHLSGFLKIFGIPSKQQMDFYEKRITQLEHKVNALGKRKVVKRK